MKLDKLDTLFSKYIRLRAMERAYGCERCLTPKVSYKDLQCCHFHGRAKKSVRWDEDNSAGLCGGCHRYLDSQAAAKVGWFQLQLGEDGFNQLEGRMRIIGKPDREALTLYYTLKIKNVKGGYLGGN